MRAKCETGTSWRALQPVANVEVLLGNFDLRRRAEMWVIPHERCEHVVSVLTGKGVCPDHFQPGPVTHLDVDVTGRCVKEDLPCALAHEPIARFAGLEDKNGVHVIAVNLNCPSRPALPPDLNCYGYV